MNYSDILGPRIDSLQRRFQIIGLVALVPCIAGAVIMPEQFFRSYLLGFMFWMNLTLGCFGWVLVHNLTGGDWGQAARRFLEAGMRLLPLMAVLFLPLLAGLPRLYEWASPEHVAHD